MNQQLQQLTEILNWIERTLASHRSQLRTVQSLGFSRLPNYYSAETLAAANAVVVSSIPVPPLSAMGLFEFADFERMAPDGITYLDTFFVRDPYAKDESLYFHELIHVAQWQYLGPERFLTLYAAGHMQSGGYRQNPFEVMAYQLQAVFDRGAPSFDVVARVKQDVDSLVMSMCR
jgi:hypothetical protein